MRSLSEFRSYLSSTYSILNNFPILKINGQCQIQYAFDLSSNLCRTTQLLHQPSLDRQRDDLPTLLILHGTLGGIDSARWHARGLSQYQPKSMEGRVYQMLSISRPGYLSSQPRCQSFSHEASIINQICERLQLKEVTLMAVSGSGPSALTFVRDYPQRVRGRLVDDFQNVFLEKNALGLILMDAIAKYVSFNALDSGLPTFLLGQNVTSNIISWLWQRYWSAELLQRLGFSGWDLVDEIRDDATVESMYRDYYLPTFAWGGYRRKGFRTELKHLKNDLPEEPKWNIHVPVLYLYGGKDRWVNDEHIQCVMKNVKAGVTKKVMQFPRGKHLLPVKESSLAVNEFLCNYIF